MNKYNTMAIFDLHPGLIQWRL